MSRMTLQAARRAGARRDRQARAGVRDDRVLGAAGGVEDGGHACPRARLRYRRSLPRPSTFHTSTEASATAAMSFNRSIPAPRTDSSP